MSVAPSPTPAPPAPAAPPTAAKATKPRASAASLAAVAAAKQAKRPATALPVPQTPVSPWAKLFRNWPAELATKGVVITKLNEPNPFKGFMLQEDFVLLERTSPDSLGGRFLLLPFDEISCVKFTEPLKEDQLQRSGFTGKLSSSGS